MLNWMRELFRAAFGSLLSGAPVVHSPYAWQPNRAEIQDINMDDDDWKIQVERALRKRR